MEKSELLVLACEYGAKEDLYALLGIDAITAKEGSKVQRAWRKASLQYHPDKAKDKFDPEKWQFLERARDVLMDAEAHAAYDAARSAALQRLQERAEMDTKKRAMIEDLEARERGSVKKMRGRAGHEMSEVERNRLAESGRRRMEERERQKQEAEERMRRAVDETTAIPVDATPATMETPQPLSDNAPDDADSKIADLERRLKEARERKEARKKRKSGAATMPSSPAVTAAAAAEAQGQAATTPIKNPVTAETEADDDQKGPRSAKSFSFTTPKSSTGTPRAKAGDFSSIRERLAHAQREKERKAKETAAATAAGAGGVNA